MVEIKRRTSQETIKSEVQDKFDVWLNWVRSTELVDLNSYVWPNGIKLLFSVVLCEVCIDAWPVLWRAGKFAFWELEVFFGFYLGFPVIIVAISLGATQADGYGSSEGCWLDVPSGLIWAFIAPAILIILVSGSYTQYICELS